MESREEKGPAVISSEAPSSYMVAPRNESHSPDAVPPPPPPPHQGLPSLPGVGFSAQSEKKKRGRPRKYGDGASGGPRPLSPMPISAAGPTTGYLAENPSSGSGGRPLFLEKKHRPKVDDNDSGDLIASMTGGGFLPHIIIVNSDEDVAMKIISFCQQGPRAICVISASGVVSNVTLREPNSSGGTMTYQGRFDILSLSGSFTPTDLGGLRAGRSGGMSISLASADGRVFGGTMAGLLTAASPVQVVVGSFLPSNYNELKPKKHKYEHKAPVDSGTAAAATAAPPPHHHHHHSSNGVEHRSTSVQGMNGGTPGMLHASTIPTSNWTGMSVADDSRSMHTDINIPLQGQ